MSDSFRKMKSLYSSTLSSSFGTGTGDTITPQSVSGLATDTQITLTFDRVDVNGDATPALMERIRGTISGGNLTSYVRGVDSTTEQAHTAGAVIEAIWNGHDWNDAIAGILVHANQDGTLKNSQTVSDWTLLSPEISVILDVYGNEALLLGAAASNAANYVKITNSISASPALIESAGDASTIDLRLRAKGAGQLDLDAYYQTPQAYTPSGGGTATLDLATGNQHDITMPAGNITVALSNAKVGQKFIVSITQDSVGSRTVSWFSTIRWFTAGGSAPTLTTTANKRDTFGFIVTGSGTYDGFIVGQGG